MIEKIVLFSVEEPLTQIRSYIFYKTDVTSKSRWSLEILTYDSTLVNLRNLVPAVKVKFRKDLWLILVNLKESSFKLFVKHIGHL